MTFHSAYIPMALTMLIILYSYTHNKPISLGSGYSFIADMVEKMLAALIYIILLLFVWLVWALFYIAST